ncbi:amino acid adenylation domain-containing protein [Streptosporangium sp. NPDC051022]|uniref:amino acid adenylation domain-containing protein n=1 Tax=Streptosporangium sp. NPDC051022 TaxID=3155752 RepID=UPI0034342E3A
MTTVEQGWQPLRPGNLETAPLSYGQRALWFLDRLTPGTAVHNIPWLLPLEGPVDAGLLKECLNAIVARHDVLRTVFAISVAEPYQVVRGTAEIDMAVIDCPREAVEDLTRLEARRPFDLERDLPARARLLRWAPDGCALVVVFHHIACDGLSLPVFERELAELYAARTEGREPRLAAPAVQYADFAAWQREQDPAEDLDYWQRRLAGAPERLTLHTDRPRPPVRSTAGAVHAFDLPPEVGERVRALAMTEGVTPFVVLFAAFVVLLHRYTGQDDIVVGSPVAGRDRIELEELIGYFVTMLPLRTRVGGDESFHELLAAIGRDVMEDLDHHRAPLDMVPDRPLMHVAFGAHSRHDAGPLRLGEASGVPRVLTTDTAKFDLLWSVFDDGHRLRGEVEYNTGLFDAATIERMAAHWLTLLAAAAEAPGTAVAELPMLTGADLDVVRGPAPVSRGADACLHERFESVAALYPGRIAVEVTYGELNARANRLARHLRATGVRPGDRVGLLLERTPRQVEAVLAVLKAGAAYVPIAPETPRDRVAFIVADANVKVTVADRTGEGVTVGLLDDEAEIAAHPSDDLRLPVATGSTAYVIYTSGSTGRPKGVAVAHANVMELFAATADRFGMGPGDVWTLFHSYTFDFSVWEMWGALLYGGRLVVVPKEVGRSPEAFALLLQRERVTFLNQTPSAFGQLVGLLEEEPRPLDHLRWIVFGGEALQPHHVRRWFATGSAPKARLCNMYGITETTVHVTAYDITPETPFGRSVIGRPLPHLSAEVLDRYGRVVPVGVPGELFVGGYGVTGEYVGRPGLTARRFPPDPAVPGARRYRSGDLVRWLPDGDLEYLGRIDDQVKIRGFRIEPGEIQRVLADHPAVRSCVVVAADGRLVAYVVPGPERPAAAELRAHLTDRLPEYMVPSAVVLLDRIPLTANGKVDLRALPEAGRPETAYDPPEGPVEQALADALAEVLKLERVGRNDNFFELGGDSVRSIQVAGRLRKAGYALPLDVLFAHPTVASAATQVTRAEDGPPLEPFALLGERDRERARARGDVVDAYPMTAMQLAMVYHMELEPERRPYHNVNSYRVAAPLDERTLTRVVTEAVERHPVLRTSFDMVSFGEPMQLVHRSVPPPLTIEDLTGADQRAAVAALVEREWSTPFALGQAPLFRVTAQRLSPSAFQLTLTEHHAILDGWSFTSLVAEILNRHALLREHPDTPKAPPPLSRFGQFVALERAATSSAESLAFWKERLSGLDGALFPDSGAAATMAQTIDREVTTELSQAMARLARTAGAGMKSVALAAHLVALGRVTGRADVITGLGVNGRIEEAAGAEALGLFLNIIPFATRLDGGTWIDLVRHVHRQETSIMPHRRTPFARFARHMRNWNLDANFTFNRFHALAGVRIDDERIGCAPTMRYEPNHFTLSVGFVQDPASDRALLLVDYPAAKLPHTVAADYADSYLEAVHAMTGQPYSNYREGF